VRRLALYPHPVTSTAILKQCPQNRKDNPNENLQHGAGLHRKTDRKRQELLHGADTVGAVARDADGRLAVAVSTGGINGKLPGRIGDSPIPGAGFYADDRFGAVCGTGQGEAFIRLALAHLMVVELQHGMDPALVAKGAVEHLSKALKAPGGVIVMPPEGEPHAAFNTPAMPWAKRAGLT